MKYIGITYSLLALFVWLAVAENVSGPPSTNLLNFISLHNGLMTNKEQISEEDQLSGERHSYLAISFQPVEVPALPGKIVFFTEETAEGIDWRLELRVISEDDAGIIKTQEYRLAADTTKHKPGSYDMGRLEELKAEDLVTHEECDALFEAIEPNVFLGTWPDCRNRTAGRDPPNYIALFTCSGISGFVTHNPIEELGRIPYTLRTSMRYDLPQYMLGGRTDWSSPCDD